LTPCLAEILDAQVQPLHRRGAPVAQAWASATVTRNRYSGGSRVAPVDQVPLHQGLINQLNRTAPGASAAAAALADQSLRCLHLAPVDHLAEL
jgi:hypothetical protein